jgi:hypothetical protein
MTRTQPSVYKKNMKNLQRSSMTEGLNTTLGQGNLCCFVQGHIRVILSAAASFVTTDPVGIGILSVVIHASHTLWPQAIVYVDAVFGKWSDVDARDTREREEHSHLDLHQVVREAAE